MRTHRIHIPNLQAGQIILTGSEAHHLIQVLRVQKGQQIKAFDGSGLEALGTIQGVHDFQVLILLESPQESQTEAIVHITLAVALLKGDKLGDVVRQATELGVVAIQPFISQHGDVKELSASKLERLRRIAQEAAKQSGRSVIPEIREAVRLEKLTLSPTTLIAHPYASSTINDVLNSPTEMMLLTGPEGGFSEHEIHALINQGAQAVRLGNRILRAETAPTAFIAAILLPDSL
jgi:16S rRNA (uracil1498-N3)-methyltransferase